MAMMGLNGEGDQMAMYSLKCPQKKKRCYDKGVPTPD
jgi:hypothetical protein